MMRPLLALLLVAPMFAACESTPPAPPAIPAGEDPHRWDAAMEAFAEADREDPFPRGEVVFVGSSSIRLWKSLARDMAPVPVLNRGFGGSRLFDAIYHAGRLVDVHAPCLVVVFSGTNDLAGVDAKSPDEVLALFRQLVARLRATDNDRPLVYIAMTPTLAREEHIPAVRTANGLIRAECDEDERLTFVDPTPDLMDAEGRPDARWFVDDRLHLNADGYAIWTRHVRPVVERRYALARRRP